MGIHAQLGLAQTWSAVQTFASGQFGSVTAETTFNIASANGVATTLARSDHTHGTPAHNQGAHSGMNIAFIDATNVFAAAQRITAGYGTVGSSNNDLVIGAGGSTPNAISMSFGDNSGWKFHIGTKVTSTFTPRLSITDSGAIEIPSGGSLTIAGNAALSVGSFDSTVPTTVTFGTSATSAAAGSTTIPSRRDHTHGFPAIFDTTAPTTVAFGTSATAAAVGSAAVAARRDHVHGFPAIFDTTAPTTSAVGDAAAVGTAAVAARRDHVHAREAFGSVTAQTSFGAASGNGSATTITRSDHTHGTPTHDQAAHSGFASYISVRDSGTLIGTRPIINVLDGTGTTAVATDDAANTEVEIKFDVNFAGSGSASTASRSDHTHGAAGHTIKENGSALTTRTGLNFVNGLIATDDAGNDETDVSLDYATPAIVLGTAAAAGSANSIIRSDATIIAFDTTAPTTISFGTSATSAATGSIAFAARRDHTHGFPAMWDSSNPEALGTAGPGSATVSARRDHVHPTTGLGVLSAANSWTNFNTWTRTETGGAGTWGSSFNTTANPSANTSGSYYGIQAFITYSATVDSTSTDGVTAGIFAATRSGGTGTVSHMTALSTTTNNSATSGTTSNMRGLWVQNLVAAAGSTISNSYGIQIANTSGSGTFTNKYGIYIDDYGTGSANNYSIFIAGVNTWSQLGGVVQLLETSAPSTPASGKGALYIKSSDSLLYFKNDAGTEFSLTAPSTSFGAPALTLTTSNAAGSASTAIRTDASIAIFDTTNPSSITFGTSATSAATGSQARAARRDHVHAFPAMWDSTVPAALGTAAAGSASVNARRDHVHPTTGLGVLSAANTWTDTNNISKTVSSPTGAAASSITTTGNFTPSGGEDLWGLRAFCVWNGPGGTVDLWSFDTKTTISGSGSIGEAYGIRTEVQIGSSTAGVTTATGLHVKTANFEVAGGSITTSYGVRIASGGSITGTSTFHGIAIDAPSGTATTQYGLKINDFGTGSTSNYSLFIAGSTTLSRTEGTFVVGTGALATTATEGFIYIPSVQGTPTGNATAYSQTVPMVVDTTNSRLYCRIGGTWKSVVLA